VAACDPDGLLAFPVTTVVAGPGAMAQLAALVAEREPVEIVLGLPRTLGGGEQQAARNVRGVAGELAVAVGGVPVRLVDERLTTVAASRLLHDAGRSARRQRAVIDQAAAVALLEQALEYERATGNPAGELVGHDTSEG